MTTMTITMSITVETTAVIITVMTTVMAVATAATVVTTTSKSMAVKVKAISLVSSPESCRLVSFPTTRSTASKQSKTPTIRYSCILSSHCRCWFSSFSYHLIFITAPLRSTFFTICNPFCGNVFVRKQINQ
ncbi:hypothetical protein BDB00DRAFT_911484, partial [Zychaea mexicana]|uniref:uncharacterized protein n=1 Tax=Zychaea mexicana TaxID=64656 RepID=UPI0022FF1A67